MKFLRKILLVMLLMMGLVMPIGLFAQFSNYNILQATNHVMRYLDGFKIVKVNIDGTALPDTADGNHTTGFTLPDECVVMDMFFYVNTADDSSSMTIDIGDTNNYDGFADGVSMASTGFVFPWATFDGDTIWSANTRGTYLSEFLQGTCQDSPGVFIPIYQSGSAGNVIYVTNKDTFPDFDVDMYIMLFEAD